MDRQIIQKTFQHKKLESIFLVNNKCQQIYGFGRIENKLILYRVKDSMKNFCTSLREHAKNIIDFEKKKMSPLTKEQIKLN